MGSATARRLRLAAGAALALALLALFFRGVDWRAVAAALRGADRALLAGVVAVTVVVYMVRAWRWGYLMAPLGRVPFPHLLSATFVGFLTGLLVPRAGEVVRPYLVGRRHSIPASAAFATIVVERLADLVTVLTLFALYFSVLPTPAAQVEGPLIERFRQAGSLVAAVAAAVLALLVAFHVRADVVTAWIDRPLGWLPRGIGGPVSRAIRAFGEGLAVLRAPASHLLVVAGQSLLLWLAIAVTFHLTNRALGVNLPFHTTFLMLGCLTVGVSVPTPGMVGGFHVAYQVALTVYGVDKDVATAAGIACHALTNLPVLAIGLVCLGREGLTMGAVAEMAEGSPAPGPAAAGGAGSRREAAGAAGVNP